MVLEERLLTSSLVNTSHEVRDVLQKLYDFSPRSAREVDEPSEEYDQAKYLLAYYVEKAFRDVGILAERLGFPDVVKEIRICGNFPHIQNLIIIE